MTDRDALHAAVLLQPSENVPRLAFADCIQEDGDDDLAEFIRAGVVTSKYRDAAVIEAQEYDDALRDIHRVCEAGHAAQWVADLDDILLSPLTSGDWSWDHTVDRVTVRIGKSLGVFTRGMLSEMTVSFLAWYHTAKGALSRWPIEKFTASDFAGLTLEIRPPPSENASWELVGTVKVPQRRIPMGGAPAAVPLAPYPYLMEPAAEFTTHTRHADRDRLVKHISRASLRIVQELEDLAGDRWPGPNSRHVANPPP